jgi:ketosteroid isomerase-like protein
MAPDQIETLQRYLRAWADGDVMAVIGLYHEELELSWPGTHRLAGVHSGRDAATLALLDLQMTTQRALVEAHVADAGGTLADVEVVERWTVDERSVELRRLLRFGVRDGCIARCVVVEHEPDLVDRLLR